MRDALLVIATLALRIALSIATHRVRWHTWFDRRKRRRDSVWTPGERHAVQWILKHRKPPPKQA